MVDWAQSIKVPTNFVYFWKRSVANVPAVKWITSDVTWSQFVTRPHTLWDLVDKLTFSVSCLQNFASCTPSPLPTPGPPPSLSLSLSLIRLTWFHVQLQLLNYFDPMDEAGSRRNSGNKTKGYEIRCDSVV